MADAAVITPTDWERRQAARECVVRAAAGDKEAFGELYDRYYGLVANYVHRRIGDQHDTEDLVSDVFVRVLRALPRFKWRHLPFEAWLYRIATNCVNDWVRKQKHRQACSLDSTSDTPALAHKTPSEPEVKEKRRAIQQAVMGLSPKHQEVIALFYFEDIPLDQIASILGCRIGTVKSRLARAREALRKRLPQKGEVVS